MGAGIPQSGSAAEITAPGTYTVTLSGVGIADSLLLDSANATFTETAAGSLNLTTTLEVDAGTAILRSANAIGSVTQTGGLIEISNANALGSGEYTVSRGELLATSSETVGNDIKLGANNFGGTITFAATAGQVLTLDKSAELTIDESAARLTVNFGDGVHDGKIVWTPAGTDAIDSAGVNVEIRSGTIFVAGSTVADGLFSAPGGGTSTIDAGAEIDIAGQNFNIGNLQGAGTLTNSGALATAVLGSGTFQGIIAGNTRLEVQTGGSVELTGANTYTTGGTQIDSGGELRLGQNTVTGSVIGAIVDDGNLVVSHTGNFTLTNLVSGTGGVAFNTSETVTVATANSYTGATQLLDGAELILSNVNALGNTSGVLFQTGELLSTTDISQTTVDFSMEENCEIAAAHGTTLTFDVIQSLFMQDALLRIGAVGSDGTVVFDAPSTADVGAIGTSVDIGDGTLEIASQTAGKFLGNSQQTIVEAGATLDLAAGSIGITGLAGKGSVVAQGATLGLDDTDFAGAIGGVSSVAFSETNVLTGTNTYTGGTQINSSAVLALGNDGSTGSVLGPIADDGTLVIDRSNAVSETAAISGSGDLIQLGNGITTIDRAESFSGGTLVSAGKLSIDRASAIGTGGLTLEGGEFLATKNLKFAHDLTMSGQFTVAAAAGTTLTVDPSSWTLQPAGARITFGDSAHAGMIVWTDPSSAVVDGNDPYSVDIHAGTFATRTSFEQLLTNAASTSVDAGAKLKLSGQDFELNDLTGAGTVANANAASVSQLNILGGNFSGHLSGALDILVFDSVTLSGVGNFSGAFELQTSSTLDLIHAWAEDTQFGTDANLILETPQSYTGTISGFAAGNTIDVRGVNFDAPRNPHSDSDGSFQLTYNATTGVLTLTDGTVTRHLTFSGAYTQAEFGASADGHGGTELTFETPTVSPLDGHVPLASEVPAHGDWFA